MIRPLPTLPAGEPMAGLGMLVGKLVLVTTAVVVGAVVLVPVAWHALRKSPETPEQA